MDEERKARLKKMVATNAQVGHGDRRKKKSKTGEDGSYHTAQIGLGDRRRKKSKNVFVLKLDFFKSRNEPARPVMITIFLVIVYDKG